MERNRKIVGVIASLVGLVFVIATLSAPAPPAASEATPHHTLGILGEPGDECVTGPNPYTSVEYETINLDNVLTQISGGQPVTLPFYGREYTMQLALWNDFIPPNAVISYSDESGIHNETLPQMVYSGNLVSNQSNQVVFGITSGFIQGYVADSDGVYVLEMSKDPNAPTHFRSARVDVSQWQGCEGGGGGSPAPPLDGTRGSSTPPGGGGGGIRPQNHAPLQTHLLFADREYFNMFWWCPFFGLQQRQCAATQMVADYASVMAFLVLDTTVRVQVPQVWVHDNVDTGGLLSFDAPTLLDQLGADARAHLNSPRGQEIFNYHEVHLFSGKNLNGNTIGIAWQPGHYSLSQHVPEVFIAYFADPYHRMTVIAHEVGHNYAATHASGMVVFFRCVFIGWTFMATWGNQPRACAYGVNSANLIHADAAIHGLCVRGAPPCMF